VKPRGLLKVVDAAGLTVHDTHIDRQQILAEDVAFQMVTMLQDVVQRGTGASARSLGLRGAAGGKTGSTNEYRDAWFVGFNASVVAGVWAGFDQPQKIREGASGARVALPIWADFMRRTASTLPPRPLVPPSGVRGEEMCMISYQRPVDGCPTYVEYFKDGDSIPSQLCPLHPGSFKQQAERAVRDLFGALGRGIRGIFR
jgi:membrane carboxypeptidase/penicillin-binding protein